MYERSFDTDWSPDEVDADEATDRLFALGVADVLGGAPDGERDRLLSLADTAYERSVFDLSFEEGQQKAREARRAPDRDADDPEAVWDDLVGADGESARASTEALRESGVPDALAPAELLDRFDDEPTLLDPPEALRRD
ncbi:MAG: hypothetical protein ABEH40_04160 [Haloferacaceae archaeon]